MFSVLISVYAKEKKSNFHEAMDSILNQSLKPDEIVLIRDGKVPEDLQETIDGYLKKEGKLITYIPLDTNGGLGNALRIGVVAAKNDYIARMDSDDICLFYRFEKQINFLNEHPNVDVVGGTIIEFVDDIDNPIGKREVPLDDLSIKHYLKKRCPFNHMTVMFRKQAVLSAGNYQDLHYLEDYYLWCRMFLKKATFSNLSDILVFARCNKDLYKRRGGLSYFQSWKQLERYKLQNGITNVFYFISTLTMRFVIQVLLPNNIRGFVMKYFGRNSITKNDLELIKKVEQSK